MGTMTLDRAKEVADCPDDRCAPECNDALRVLRRALRDAEAQVAFLNAKLATARADAIEEAARAVEDHGTKRHGLPAGHSSSVAIEYANAVRALAPKPPVENPGPVEPPPFDAQRALVTGQRFIRDRYPRPVSLGSSDLITMLDAMLAAGSAK